MGLGLPIGASRAYQWAPEDNGFLCYRIFQHPVFQQGGCLTFTDTWFLFCRWHSLFPIHHFSVEQRSSAHTMPLTVLFKLPLSTGLKAAGKATISAWLQGCAYPPQPSSSSVCCPRDSQSLSQFLLPICVDKMIQDGSRDTGASLLCQSSCCWLQNQTIGWGDVSAGKVLSIDA